MKKIYIYLIIALCAIAMPKAAMAAEWTYNFEDIQQVMGNRGPREAIDVNFNGLAWHLYGAKRNMDDMDWADGEGSLCLNATLLNSSILATETPNITLSEMRSIGKFEFHIAAHEYWKSSQEWWIVQYTIDGNNWITTGDAFAASETPTIISRTINQPSARVRIVREDYATYDYTSGQSYEKKINFDNFRLTDYDGQTSPVLSASVASLDFGELQKGEEKTLSFTLTHKNITDGVGMEIIGDDAVYFTLLTENISDGDETEISIKCVGKRKGDYKAVFRATADELQLNLQMTATGKIDDAAMFSGGSGTETDPYLISDASDMQQLSTMVNDEGNSCEGLYFLVTNDINMQSAGNFRTIANMYNRSSILDAPYFAGTFDGGNHTLRNLTISNNYNFVALFGILKGGTIKNLTISQSSIFAAIGVAPLVAVIFEYGTVENCHVTSDVTVTNDHMYSSGLVLTTMAYEGAPAGKIIRISDCTTAARVYDFTGGAAGILCRQTVQNAVIERCGNMGEITSTNFNVAGILMTAIATTTITDCYNTGKLFLQDMNSQGGTIQTNARGGGIVASAADATKGPIDGVLTIKNCYSAGYMSESSIRLHHIFNPDEIFEEAYVLENNYYDIDRGGNIYTYATPVSESVMKTDEFVAMLNDGNANGCWTIIADKNNGFPVPESDNLTAITSTKSTAEPTININGGNVAVNGNYNSVSVYDLNGSKQSLSNLVRGIYIVKIEAEGKTLTKKVVIK